MKTAILYTRVSTKMQLDGQSMRAQADLMCQYCDENDIEVLKIYEEGAASARTLDRPGIMQMCLSARKLRADMIMCWGFDRLTRSVKDFKEIVSVLGEYGITVRCAATGYDSRTHKKRALLAVDFAEKESALIGRRTRDGMRAASNRGVRLGRPPNGWSIDHGEWIRNERYPLVERIHDMRSGVIDGVPMTLQSICDVLNHDETPTPSGRGRWGVSMVARHLRSPLHAPMYDTTGAGT